jgi:hypothetical protein
MSLFPQGGLNDGVEVPANIFAVPKSNLVWNQEQILAWLELKRNGEWIGDERWKLLGELIDDIEGRRE